MWRVEGGPEGDGGEFVEVCTRRYLKFNANESKVMVLSGEEGLQCEICVDEVRLEQLPVIRYL